MVAVEQERLANGVEGQTSVGVAEAHREEGHLRAVELRAEDAAGAGELDPRAVGADDVVVVVARCQVEPAIGTDGQAAQASTIDRREAVGEDGPGLELAISVLVAPLLEPPDAGHEEAVLPGEDASGHLAAVDDDLGRLVDAVAVRVPEPLDDVGRGLPAPPDPGRPALGEGQGLPGLDRAIGGLPLGDEEVAEVVEGHARRVDDGRLGRDDPDLEPLGRGVRLEPGVGLG